ncbi:MAG: MBL fold metallo-hydrolase [bacterium]|nr:MBL fold metallo-hydrolase [bacterium]
MSEPDDLFIEQLACGPMQNFVYLVGSNRTREVVIVDPAWSIAGLLEHIDNQGLTPIAALVTHYHPDHIGGAIFNQEIEGLPELMTQRPMKIYANKLEAEGVCRVTGLSDNDMVKVDSGDKMTVGDVEIEFLHTPGHTPGSQCFKARNALVSGDTLFIQGCGRVDLPGANPDDMYRSICQLADLPDDTILFPGHDYGGGANRSMAETKKVNPYLRIPDLETWRQMMGG